MKLLSKSDVQKAKSLDRQREIDEGLKLARRVDALREIAAAEESSLAKFRIETIAKIHDEISILAAKRDELQIEADSILENARNEAQTIIMEAELKALSTAGLQTR